MQHIIGSFTDNYFFLSNFYRVDILAKGIVYPTAEHLYAASKTTDKDKWEHIAYNIKAPASAKRYGRSLKLRDGFDNQRVSFMRSILNLKFQQNYPLRDLLIDTGIRELEEGNYWCDNFWGICYCGVCEGSRGENNLGKLLIGLRGQLKREAT